MGPDRSSNSPPAPAGRVPERRGVPRTVVDRPVRLRFADGEDGQPVDARMTDLSASGVGLRLSTPVAPGREFVLDLPNTPAVATPLRYRVVRCRPLGRGEFQVGAAFVRTPAGPPAASADAAPTTEAPSNAAAPPPSP